MKHDRRQKVPLAMQEPACLLIKKTTCQSLGGHQGDFDSNHGRVDDGAHQLLSSVAQSMYIVSAGDVCGKSNPTCMTETRQTDILSCSSSG
jgi:hypothetical protein